MIFRLFKIGIVSILICGLVACEQFPFRSGHSVFSQRMATASNLSTMQIGSGSKNFLAANKTTALYNAMGGNNLWDRIRSDFQLSHAANNAAVQAQIRWFVKHPRYLNNTINRSAPYLYYIYDQVQQRNLPAELVLLPIIESAYNPLATNASSGASGLWQLIPSTAKNLGVRQYWWFDGRRDIYLSTKAALDYLTYLNNFFGGDWLLALAAYDTGEGNVQNAVRHNAYRDYATTFWSLPLAIETRSYVPRLLALAEIVKNPDKYHIILPIISDQPYLAQIQIKTRLTLNDVAHLSGVTVHHIKQLNPGVKGKTIPAQHAYALVLPIDRITEFKHKLLTRTKIQRTNNISIKLAKTTQQIRHKYSRHTALSVRYYTVRSGDSLFKIAKRLGIKTQQLKHCNALARDTLKPGQKLQIKV